VNMGGVIGASREGQSPGDGDEAALRDTERIAGVLTSVFDLAERDRISTHAAAVRMARDKIRSRKGL
jgi:hypothetical protein